MEAFADGMFAINAANDAPLRFLVGEHTPGLLLSCQRSWTRLRLLVHLHLVSFLHSWSSDLPTSHVPSIRRRGQMVTIKARTKPRKLTSVSHPSRLARPESSS